MYKNNVGSRCRGIARLAATLVGGLLAAGVQAQDYGPQHSDVPAFVEKMQIEHGFSAEHVQQVLDQAVRQEAILKAIARPAERVKPWHEYRAIFITDKRIESGLAFWDEHAEALARAEKEYGVEPEIILAIIGVETFYGGNMGSYRVIDALTTLGFDYPPRADFFRRQLESYLVLTREQQMDPLTLKGSYAGAMGYGQFIPSSYQAFAVDFDHDGVVDIWNNPVDAIGSVANYFHQHKWQHGAAVAIAADVEGDQVAQGITLEQGLEARKTVAELQRLGWTPRTQLEQDAEVMAFEFDAGERMQYWLGLNNLYVITRYNRSVMYAMVVHQLADLLREARPQ
ncbi:MAG: lytic murein transglycosylase B [Halopseudomonas sp.]|uniref:lytic murein transglycosylase B n=1 Tax=Halopseudomonas sp. TaxID=2901191 RepID=UPI0030026ED0